MKRTVILISLFISVYFSVNAQISTHEEPVSFREKTLSRSPSRDIRTMPVLNMNIIEQEDEEDEANGIPPRFGYSHKVDFNLQNSGNWQELSNGDKLWQLTICCPQALSINLLYDNFWLPEGGKFFIYTTDRKHSIGAFTSVNNKGDGRNVQGFATGLLYGDEITLEYYQPKQISEQAIISVAYVVQGYRYVQLPSETRSLGSSGSCQVNINCPEGQGWQQEKNAVALILVNGNRYCTGSLVNTTANDNRPLFLTADHCLGGWANDYVKYDAMNDSILAHWSFYWHYEAPGCSNTSIEPPILSTSGATVVANNSISDFALLRLTEDPRNKQGVTPYYLGWDRSGNAGTGGVGIHHPRGDVKKISTYDNTPSNSDCFYNNGTNFWKINWKNTLNGFSVTEGGSSGSPLLNNNRKVVGQLYGAGPLCPNPNCSNPSQDIGNYGKFSVSWTGNGATDSRRRLRDWLDPQGTNPQTLDGMGRPTLSGPASVCNQATYSIENLPAGATVQWSAHPALQISSQQNNAIVVSGTTITGGCWVRAEISPPFDRVLRKENITVWQSGTHETPHLIQGEITPTGGNVRLSNEILAGTSNYYWWTDYETWTAVSQGRPYTLFTGSYNPSVADSASIIVDLTTPCGESVTLYRVFRWGNFRGNPPSFTLSPNPATDMVTVRLEEETAEAVSGIGMRKTATPGPYEIQLWSAAALIRSYKTDLPAYTIPVSDLPEGIYFVRVIRDGKTHTRKLLKK